MSGATEAPLLRQRTPEQRFITGWGLVEGGLAASAVVPGDHRLYGDAASGHWDVVLVADVISQIGIVTTTRLLDIGIEWDFMVREFRVGLDPIESMVRGDGPLEMTLRAAGDEITIKSRGSSERGGAGTLSIRTSVGERQSGDAFVSTYWLSERRWEELRRRVRRHLGPPDAPAGPLQPERLTGRRDPANAVISTLEASQDGGYECLVLVDIGDPTFFGVPLDHVNGLLLMEAAQQGTIAAACRELDASPASLLVDRAQISFLSFAELDRLTRCAVHFDGESASVELSQSGWAVARAEMGVRRL